MKIISNKLIIVLILFVVLISSITNISYAKKYESPEDAKGALESAYTGSWEEFYNVFKEIYYSDYKEVIEAKHCEKIVGKQSVNITEEYGNKAPGMINFISQVRTEYGITEGDSSGTENWNEFYKRFKACFESSNPIVKGSLTKEDYIRMANGPTSADYKECNNRIDKVAADTLKYKVQSSEEYKKIMRNNSGTTNSGESTTPIDTETKPPSAGTIIEDAQGFIAEGEKNVGDVVNQKDMQNLISIIYNILLVIAIVIAVILGLILGIKFITEGVEGQAKVKESLIPYIAGCIVVFGAFTIWKIIVLILQGMEK